MKVRDILVEHKQGYYKPEKIDSGDVHLARISDITDEAYLDKNTTPMIKVDRDVVSKFGIKKMISCLPALAEQEDLHWFRKIFEEYLHHT